MRERTLSTAVMSSLERIIVSSDSAVALKSRRHASPSSALYSYRGGEWVHAVRSHRSLAAPGSVYQGCARGGGGGGGKGGKGDRGGKGTRESMAARGSGGELR